MAGSAEGSTTGRVWIRRLFIAGLCGTGLTLAIVLLVLYPFFPGALIEFRFAIFSRVVPDTAALNLPPQQLFHSGFLRDDLGVIATWRELAESELPQMADLPHGFDRLPTLERARLLARRNSGGAGNGLFSDRETLIDRLRRVPDGVGCCSDVTETFLALCSINQIDAYEFSTVHTIASVFCPELGKWVAIDPQFCLLFRGEDGEYLSPVQLRETGLSGRPVAFESFWDESRGPAPQAPFNLGYYSDPAAFRELVMTFGNNVFAVDEVRRHWRWIPKPIRQLYYRIIRIMPDYVIVDDAVAGRAKTLPVLRYALFGLATLLLAMVLPQVLVWIACCCFPRAGVCARPPRAAAADAQQARSAHQ